MVVVIAATIMATMNMEAVAVVVKVALIFLHFTTTQPHNSNTQITQTNKAAETVAKTSTIKKTVATSTISLSNSSISSTSTMRTSSSKCSTVVSNIALAILTMRPKFYLIAIDMRMVGTMGVVSITFTWITIVKVVTMVVVQAAIVKRFIKTRLL